MLHASHCLAALLTVLLLQSTNKESVWFIIRLQNILSLHCLSTPCIVSPPGTSTSVSCRSRLRKDADLWHIHKHAYTHTHTQWNKSFTRFNNTTSRWGQKTTSQLKQSCSSRELRTYTHTRGDLQICAYSECTYMTYINTLRYTHIQTLTMILNLGQK